MKDLSISKKLLSSVTSVLKDSSKAVAEQSKAAAEQLNSKYARSTARPLAAEEAKAAAMESRAPNKRVYDAISQVYTKSVAEAKEQAKQEVEVMNRAYSKVGAAKPITESKEKKTDVLVNPVHTETLKSRKAKMQADVADETILDGEMVEGFADMDAFLKKKKEQEGTGKFEKKKISTGTVYTKKPEKEQKSMEEAKAHTIPSTEREKDLAAKAHPKDKITHKDVLVARGAIKEATPPKNTDVSDKSWLKTAGKKPGALHNVGAGLKAFLQGKKEPMESVEVAGEVVEEKDTPGNGYEHQCAIHVKHAKLGEGKTLFSQHAEPNAEGLIEWYDVMFEHGIEKKVPTSDLEILVSESHMNHKKKKAM